MTLDAFSKWCEALEASGTRFVRHRQWDKVYEVVDVNWRGTKGEATCKLFLDERRFPEHRYRIEFQHLEPLNAMEVIACASQAEVDPKLPS
jgi:hypothetical protein